MIAARESQARVGVRLSPRARARAVGRWLLAPPADVVGVRWRHAGADGAAPAVPLAEGLRRWRRRIERARSLGVARRWLAVALALGVVLAAPGTAAAPALIASGAVLVLGAALTLARRPSLTAVARLLDERLALAERIATAWELAGGPSDGPLVAQVDREARAALGRSLHDARARPRRAGAEWLVLLVAAAAIAAIVLIGPRDDARTTAEAGHRPARHAAPGPSAARAPARKHGGPEPSRGSSLYANNPYAPAYVKALIKRLRNQPHISYTSPGLGPDLATGGAAPPSSTSATGRAGTANRGARGATLGSSTQAAGTPASGATSAIQPVAPARPGRPGAGGTPQSPGARSGATPSAATGGTPTGAGGAGHQRGTSRTGAARPGTRVTGDVGLPLQGRYAPGRAGPGAKPGQRGSGGGGRSRTQHVTGTGGAGGAFPYIPSAGTPLGGGQASLVLAYLHELSVLAGRSR
jgi:hypothetical protein